MRKFNRKKEIKCAQCQKIRNFMSLQSHCGCNLSYMIRLKRSFSVIKWKDMDPLKLTSILHSKIWTISIIIEIFQIRRRFVIIRRRWMNFSSKKWNQRRGQFVVEFCNMEVLVAVRRDYRWLRFLRWSRRRSLSLIPQEILS